MHEHRIEIGPPELAAPYSFDFHLRHYVIAPETREGDALVEIFRLASGRLVRVEIRSEGTVDAPRLGLRVACRERVPDPDLAEIHDRIVWHLCLDEDMKPFYGLVEDDPVLSASVAFNYGAKDKSAYTMFDALIDCICAQNTRFRRLYTMRARLAAAFGDPFELDGRLYHGAPTPARLAAAPLDAIRACGVGYRDRPIKLLAQAVVDGVELETIGRLPREEARQQLMALHGIGPYTADLALIMGARRRDWMPLDLYLREALRQFYFGGASVPDDELRRFAEAAWDGHQGSAGLYLATNTELWAGAAGMTFRLRSGARNEIP